MRSICILKTVLGKSGVNNLFSLLITKVKQIKHARKSHFLNFSYKIIFGKFGKRFFWFLFFDFLIETKDKLVIKYAGKHLEFFLDHINM